jgi:hypothetical protein
MRFRSRSSEANDNLFTIIFDYLVISYFHRKRAKHKKSKEKEEKSAQRLPSESDDSLDIEESTQFQYIFELLKRLEAPQYFNQIFKFIPENFTERMMKFILETCTASANAVASATEKRITSQHIPSSEGSQLHKLIEKIDRNLLETIINDFQKLAERHLKVIEREGRNPCI